MSRTLRSYGPLRPTTFDLLELLNLHTGGMTRDEIARRLQIKPGSATTRIARLTRSGYTLTTRATHDTPATARITTRGREALAQAFNELDARIAA